MEVPYRNKKTGAVSPGLRCMKPHMKNHPWCRQANSEEGPSITGSKFQREGSNYDAWAISEIGKFEGNVAHSMSSGVWISGCAKNVAIFEGTGEYLMQTQKQCSCNCRYSFIFFFSSLLLFYCLLYNHTFQTNPNSITNVFKLFSLSLKIQSFITPQVDSNG